MLIYSKIKFLIGRKFPTTKEFLDKVELSKSGFSAMVENNTMNMKTLEKISDALEVPLSYWFKNDDEENDLDCSKKLMAAQEKIIELQSQIIRLQDNSRKK